MEVENQETFQITMNTLANCMSEIIPFLQDENVFEVYINPDGKVWTDSFRGREYTNVKMAATQVKQIILNVAALTDQLVTDEKPALDAEIPQNKYFDKCRFEGNLPGIVLSPTLNIRKHPKKIFTLEDYVKQEILSEKQQEIIVKAIHEKKNIIAAGGTKSGKTTLLNAILAEISKLNDRVILIEDTPELQCTAADCVSMRTMRTFTMSDCLRSVLRMTPDRIVVGEVRGGEALALLDARRLFDSSLKFSKRYTIEIGKYDSESFTKSATGDNRASNQYDNLLKISWKSANSRRYNRSEWV